MVKDGGPIKKRMYSGEISMVGETIAANIQRWSSPPQRRVYKWNEEDFKSLNKINATATLRTCQRMKLPKTTKGPIFLIYFDVKK